jgi:hypothetical protein
MGTTFINLNDTEPPAEPGYTNVKWQAAAPTNTGPGGALLRSISAELPLPVENATIQINGEGVSDDWIVTFNAARPWHFNGA